MGMKMAVMLAISSDFEKVKHLAAKLVVHLAELLDVSPVDNLA